MGAQGEDGASFVSVWHLAVMMGMSKNVAAVFFCLAGIAAGAGCFCACCNWAWCDNCQTGCCQGTLCQPPNCEATPGPSPPPPQPGWQPQGPGCCPSEKCGGNKYYYGIAWRTGSLRGEMQSNWREVCERLDQCSLVLRVLRAVRLLPRRFADQLPALREGECGHARACEHHSKCDLAAEHPDCSSYLLLHRFICRASGGIGHPFPLCESHGVECREKQHKKKKKKKKKKKEKKKKKKKKKK